MALGRSHSCALIEGDEGQPAGVYCWGDHEFGQLGVGGGLSATHMPQRALEQALPLPIAAGDDHTCALEQDGQGIPSYGLLGSQCARRCRSTGWSRNAHSAYADSP